MAIAFATIALLVIAFVAIALLAIAFVAIAYLPIAPLVGTHNWNSVYYLSNAHFLLCYFLQRRIFVLANEENEEAREFFILGGTKGSTCFFISET